MPRCGRMGIRKQKLLSSPTDSRAQRALVKEILFIFCPAAENEPKERAEGTEVPSGSPTAAVFPQSLKFTCRLPHPAGAGCREEFLKWPRGGGIGWEVTLIRHHFVSARRASVRSALARRYKVHPFRQLMPRSWCNFVYFPVLIYFLAASFPRHQPMPRQTQSAGFLATVAEMPRLRRSSSGRPSS